MTRGDRRALRHRRACAVAAAALAFATGCAEAPAPPAAGAPATVDGDPDAPPSLLALPELPADANTPRTHQGLLAARATLDAALPAAPVDRTFTSLQRWVDSDVLAWLERRRAQTLATRDRFFIEGEPSDGERIVSLAVVGLLDEDTARALGNLPPPSELDSEPDIAAMYRDVTRVQAGTFMSAAIAALRDCANSAYRGPDSWRGFAHFCHARFDRLQQEWQDPQAAAAMPARVASAPRPQ